MKGVNIIGVFLGVSVLLLSSCLKKDFETPPDQSGYDPMLPVNATIADVKALKPDFAGNLNGYVKIDTNFIIYGIVTADDRSGNLYKQINIEDSSGGIAILIDAYSLYNQYPVGRKIYVNLKGLYIGHYNGLPQIGYAPDNTGSITNIPVVAVNKYITKANYPNPVSPIEVTLADIKYYRYDLVSRMITIKNVQFQDGFLDSPYAAPAPISGTNTMIEDCSDNSILIRTSGYAKFQPFVVPSGNGTITALYTVFRTTPQLVIRDTTDVQFYGQRCGADKALVSLDSFRKIYKGAPVKLPAMKITGVVISDAAYGNTTSSSIILQQGDRGIYIFGLSGSYSLGDSLVIDVTGDDLKDYNGVLELEVINGKTSDIKIVGTKKTVIPRDLTISQVQASYAGGIHSVYESTLVKINNATASGGTYGSNNGNVNLSDGTGSLVLYTSSGATFANQSLPSGQKTYTGILGRYKTTIQVRLRNPKTDVQ